VFYHPLFDHGIFQIGQRIFEDHIQRPSEDLLREGVAARPIRKLHHINLGLRKKVLRGRVEKHQADIQRVHRLSGTVGNPHLATQLGKIHGAGIGQQVAADLAEKILNQRKFKVVQRGSVVDAVVERNRGRQADQLDFLFVLGPDGGGTFAKIVGKFTVAFSQ